MNREKRRKRENEKKKQAKKDKHMQDLNLYAKHIEENAIKKVNDTWDKLGDIIVHAMKVHHISMERIELIVNYFNTKYNEEAKDGKIYPLDGDVLKNKFILSQNAVQDLQESIKADICSKCDTYRTNCKYNHVLKICKHK